MLIGGDRRHSTSIGELTCWPLGLRCDLRNILHCIHGFQISIWKEKNIMYSSTIHEFAVQWGTAKKDHVATRTTLLLHRPLLPKKPKETTRRSKRQAQIRQSRQCQQERGAVPQSAGYGRLPSRVLQNTKSTNLCCSRRKRYC